MSRAAALFILAEPGSRTRRKSRVF